MISVAEKVFHRWKTFQNRIKFMKEKFIQTIVERLERDADALAADFRADKNVATHFTAIDDLLPDEWARQIHAAFPPMTEMRLLDSFREKKFTSKSLDKFDPIISDITFAFQDKRVIDAVSRITV